MRNIRVFITADALLAAILLVWAQLWIHPSIDLFSQEYPKQAALPYWSSVNLSAGFGLVWTHAAVFLALLALAYAGWSSLVRHLEAEADNVPDLAIGLFGASLVMAIFNVGQSIISVGIKFVAGKEVWESMVREFFGSDRWFLIGIAAFAFASILGLSICCARRKKYIRWVVGLIALCLVLVLAIAVGSFFIEKPFLSECWKKGVIIGLVIACLCCLFIRFKPYLNHRFPDV